MGLNNLVNYLNPSLLATLANKEVNPTYDEAMRKESWIYCSDGTGSSHPSKDEGLYDCPET